MPDTQTTRFEVGETYLARWITDSQLRTEHTVVRRTARFVTLADARGSETRHGIRLVQGDHGPVETCLPFGSYSMAPVLKADRPAVAA